MKNMVQIALVLIASMDYNALFATTPGGSNFLSVLASRGYVEALQHLLTALSEAQVAGGRGEMANVVTELLNDTSRHGKNFTVVDVAALSSRVTAEYLIATWGGRHTQPLPWLRRQQRADFVQRPWHPQGPQNAGRGPRRRGSGNGNDGGQPYRYGGAR